jgi:PAS domain S-box-containing protein
MAFQIDEFSRVLAVNAPDAIIYADADGLIRFWNRGAERLFGFSQQEALGQSLDIIIPPNLRKRHWDGYAHTMQTGITRYGDGEILAVPALQKTGNRISVEFTILPFHGSEGQMLGIGAILRDVTKRYEEMKALRAALEAAKLAHGYDKI